MLLVLAGVALGAPACGSDGGGAPASASVTFVEFPNIVGTWTGPYSYAYEAADGSPKGLPSHQRLVIEHQEGPLVWGSDRFLDDGKPTSIPVRGSFDVTGRELFLAEDGGYFRALVEDERTMSVTFIRTDEQYTAFSAVLTRR